MEESLRERLRKLINDCHFLIHCARCDEYICGGTDGSGTYHEIPEEELDRIWNEVKEWK